MNGAADSNHTCAVYTDITRNEAVGCLYSNFGKWNLKQIEMKKIYKLLSLRNKIGSNVKHLKSEGAFDVALLAKSLEMVQKYSQYGGTKEKIKRTDDEVEPLSII